MAACAPGLLNQSEVVGQKCAGEMARYLNAYVHTQKKSSQLHLRQFFARGREMVFGGGGVDAGCNLISLFKRCSMEELLGPAHSSRKKKKERKKKKAFFMRRPCVRAHTCASHYAAPASRG